MARLAPEEVGLHSVRPKAGARHSRKRVGRGAGSGLGKTSGRGEKGAGARSGNKRKPGYEGGQNPIHMRTRKLRGPVKILARGELTKKLTVRAHAFSGAAREKIEKAGGTAEVIAEPDRAAPRASAGSGSEADQPPD